MSHPKGEQSSVKILDVHLKCKSSNSNMSHITDYSTKPGYLCKWKVREETSETHTAKWQSYPRTGSSSPGIFLTMHIVYAK